MVNIETEGFKLESYKSFKLLGLPIDHNLTFDIRYIRMNLMRFNTVAPKYLTNTDNITFWDINVSIYTTAVTIKQELNDLKEINRNINAKNTSPWWRNKFEDSINRMRKEIGQIHTFVNC